MSEHEADTVTDQQATTQRLRRPTDGRVVAGVAAGLAEHLRIDVTLVRVLFVLATPFNLLGVLVYGLLWLLVPSEGESSDTDAPGGSAPSWADGARWSGRSVGFWAGIGLIGVGALWLLPAGPLWILGPGSGEGVLLPLLLIGGGLALWLSEDRRAAASPDGPPHAAGPPPAAGPTRSEVTATTPAPEQGPPSAPPPAPPAPPAGDGGHASQGGTPPPPTRERSPLVRVTLGLALLVAGGLWWLAGPVDVVDVRAEEILGAALLVVAAGLLVGSRWGRGRLLILAGVPLSLLLAVALIAPVVVPTVPWAGTVGQGHVVVEDAADLQAEYEHVAGELRLDLRSLDLEDNAATRVAVGAGQVEVFLPPDLPVEVDAAVSVGQLSVLGMRRTGIAPSVEVADGSGGATLVLEVHIGAGELLVTRDPPDDDGWDRSGSRRSQRPSSLAPEVR